MSLARQRCFHHPVREAAARCPECGRDYCRECITEHEGRVLCADCLAKGTTAQSDRRTWLAGLRRVAFAALGFVLLVGVFHLLGGWLARTPALFRELP